MAAKVIADLKAGNVYVEKVEGIGRVAFLKLADNKAVNLNTYSVFNLDNHVHDLVEEYYDNLAEYLRNE